MAKDFDGVENESNGDNGQMDGWVSLVAIWDYALSEEEVLRIYIDGVET